MAPAEAAVLGFLKLLSSLRTVVLSNPTSHHLGTEQNRPTLSTSLPFLNRRRPSCPPEPLSPRDTYAGGPPSKAGAQSPTAAPGTPESLHPQRAHSGGSRGVGSLGHGGRQTLKHCPLPHPHHLPHGPGVLPEVMVRRRRHSSGRALSPPLPGNAGPSKGKLVSG